MQRRVDQANRETAASSHGTCVIGRTRVQQGTYRGMRLDFLPMLGYFEVELMKSSVSTNCVRPAAWTPRFTAAFIMRECFLRRRVPVKFYEEKR